MSLVGAGGPPSSDDQSASSEDKDCPSPSLDTSKESKSGEASATVSSSSAESSSDSESESDNEEPKAERPTEDLGQPSTEQVPTQESQRIRPGCEHCNADIKLSEQVTPRLLCKGQFLLKVDGEGTYQCTETGLIFEVTRKVDIKYCVLSWSKFADLVEKPWLVGGPLFDVKCEPGGLSSIQFPHSLCLGHHDTDMTFRVFHVKSSGASLEHAVDHSGTHVTWRVSSLSPVGPVIQSEDAVSHHGAVILYKAIDQNPSLSFRVYIATNNESFIKDISKSVKHSSKKFVKIDKPPVCQKKLQNGKKYRLISEPEAEITPEEIEFVDGSLLKLKSYIEVYLEQPVEFKLLLVEMDSEEIVWKAKLRECDWTQQDQNRNTPKSGLSGPRRRKGSLSLPEEGAYEKRMRQGDPPEGAKARTPLTDAQLITLAGRLGPDWVKVAVANLELDMSTIDAILEKKEDVTICKFRMLKKWQEKAQAHATAQNLYSLLKAVVSAEAQEVLAGNVKSAQRS